MGRVVLLVVVEPVSPAATDDDVVAPAGGEDVVGIAALECIVAASADELEADGIVADDKVIATSAVDGSFERPGVDDVIVLTADEVGDAAFESVVAAIAIFLDVAQVKMSDDAGGGPGVIETVHVLPLGRPT